VTGAAARVMKFHRFSGTLPSRQPEEESMCDHRNALNSQKFAEANPNTVAALQRALAKGLKFAHDNPDKLRDIYPTFTTLKPELARKMVLSYTPEKSDFTELKKIADLMDRLQMLPGKTRLPDVAMSHR
jgi:ABC-type nitrate/sulfonate/bicarbonate transport system substrate-binding protein